MNRTTSILLPTFILMIVWHSEAAAQPRQEPVDAATALRAYREVLREFRDDYGGARDMPDVHFFQFGMGTRTKYLFKSGCLIRVHDSQVIRKWDVRGEDIVPPDYLVQMSTRDGAAVRIYEDEQAVWIEAGGAREPVPGTNKGIKLPRFSEHRYASVLRVLHHEILINVVDGRPVPNHYVYDKPWYRDAAMMAMCLKATNNLSLIREWILGLREPYDRNNAGETEADNLGQALYLVSLVSDSHHPLVPRIHDELPKFEVVDKDGRHIRGRSDFAAHPVYQTKWAKYGLRAIGLRDPYRIPAVADPYSSLFWMDYRGQHVAGTEATNRDRYPYLGWATDHFQGKRRSPISNRDYPLTWEAHAREADYHGMAIIDQQFVELKTCTPHTWHAAEIFLYLLDK